MTNMDDRQKAFESKYAYDQEMLFRIEARACKLFGLWVAQQVGIEGDDARIFAGSIVSANLEEPGFADVFRTVKTTLAEKAIEISDHTMEVRLDQFLEEARQQIVNESKSA